jgi:hypothetical protein
MERIWDLLILATVSFFGEVGAAAVLVFRLELARTGESKRRFLLRVLRRRDMADINRIPSLGLSHWDVTGPTN